MNVPKICQTTTWSCGPASLAMILQFYGDNKTEQEIINWHGGKKIVTTTGIEGTYVVDNAIYALELGYKVDCYVDNGLADISQALSTQDHREFKRVLTEVRTGSGGIPQKTIASYLRLKELGGNFIVKKPEIDDLTGPITRENLPLMANLSSRLLYRNTAPKDAGHSVVVTDYSHGVIHFNDPCGVLDHADEDHFMQALEYYSRRHSCYLIAIRKAHSDGSP